jgi:hypothetical protein
VVGAVMNINEARNYLSGLLKSKHKRYIQDVMDGDFAKDMAEEYERLRLKSKKKKNNEN